MLRGWFLGVTGRRRSRLIWCWVVGEADLGVPLLRVVGLVGFLVKFCNGAVGFETSNDSRVPSRDFVLICDHGVGWGILSVFSFFIGE